VPTVLDRRFTGLPEGIPINPLQELGVPLMNTDNNILVVAPTASGKSTFINMFGAKHLAEGKSIVYVGIMKALADEKRDEWSEEGHPWEKIAKASVTGDFVFTKQDVEALKDAKLIVVTPESLASRIRHHSSDKSAFLKNVGLIVFDEIHLVGAGERGANMEAAIMEFTQDFPEAQILALSATVPNRGEFGQWLSNLNNKDTHIIYSEYRSVPIEEKFISYEAGGGALHDEERKIEKVIQILNEKPGEQFMVCVWKKAFGRKLEQRLKAQDVPCAFHNANLTRTTRKDIEHSFKQKGLRVIINTQTLTTGVNLPARNVIITSVERGKSYPIPVYELKQAAGRAGRPRYDDRGYVFYLIPNVRIEEHVTRLERGEKILSQMSNEAMVATHYIGAIYLDRIHNRKEFHGWFERTLASVQYNFSQSRVDNLVQSIENDMKSRGLLVVDKDNDNEYILTHRGKIAAQLYLDPYHFSDLLKNMTRLSSILAPNDVDIAKAFGACDGFYREYVSTDEKGVIPPIIQDNCPKPYWQACACIWYRLQGQTVPSVLYSVNWEIFNDIDRIGEGLIRARNESERHKWEGLSEDMIRNMLVRIKKSCTKRQADLYLSQFSKGETTKLMRLGIYTLEDAKNNVNLVSEVLKVDRMRELGIM
jgi:replicative superfamily II helicase